MIRVIICALWILLLFPSGLPAQVKQAQAVRVTGGAVRIDGLLDDVPWNQAVPIQDFIQKEPNEGLPPTERTEVRILYDDSALYIGARMYSRERGGIQAPLGRRDGVEDLAEYLMVSLDTFHDRLTAYSFGVTATGVRLDRYYPQDDEGRFDEGFDPVWQARTNIEEESWTAELWIPFSQLRFNDQAEQVWGLNLQRFTPTLNEMDYWIPVPRTETAWASRFGGLRGIEGIRPTKRIEALPYVAGAATLNGNRDARNPFDDGRNLESRAGLDMKMGIGPNLTLDATFNPDFGQVEADPSEVNLTANETFFPEKRPFFTEGVQLLNMSNTNNFFYSRRIGATPAASVSGQFVDYPKASTILAAGKLTGRLSSGTSLGLLAAVTDQEFARVSTEGSSQVERIRVAPRTSYGLMRVQQEFGRWGSTFGAMMAAVHRDFKSNDPLAALLPQNAFTVAGDSILRFSGGQLQVRPFAGFTFVNGESAAIARIQRSAVHYLQRPDKDYFVYDPTRTSLNGSKSGISVERTGGRHWLGESSIEVESPGFEANDIGRLSNADGINVNNSITYRETVPGRFLRNYSFQLEQNNEWNFGGTRQGGGFSAETELTFNNFWSADFETNVNFRTLDGRLTRGGPLMGRPGGWSQQISLENRDAAQTAWEVSLEIGRDEAGGRQLEANSSLSFRPGPRWQVSLNPGYIRETDSQQYVTTLAGGKPATFGQRYIFSYIDRTTLSTQLRMGYTLRPDVNIDVYAEPFAASGRYYEFGELPAPRARDRRVYGTDGTTVLALPDGSRRITDGSSSFTLRNYDFNVRSFRSNVVLRWEWRPGSTLYLVWQQDRQISEPLSVRAGVGDVFGSLTAPGSNYFVVKMSFWKPLG
jgi:hypothetical protein